jgi:hypothetical protein
MKPPKIYIQYFCKKVFSGGGWSAAEGGIGWLVFGSMRSAGGGWREGLRTKAVCQLTAAV